MLSDRFYDSTLAYQGYGHGLELETLRRLRRLSCTNGLTPDLTLLFDIDAETGAASPPGRRGRVNRLDAYALEFHRRVRDGYLTLAQAEPERWVRLDWTQSVEE